MAPSSASPTPMRESAATAPSPLAIAAQPGETGVIRVLGERLELVEDLWLTILRSECGPQQLERLLRLKELVGPLNPGETAAGDSETPSSKSEQIVAVIQAMDLADGIAAARAFSLYFQLITILEPHIEEDSSLESLRSAPAPASSDPF
ncbi:MAG: phosphoenolpyruvate carboxylase, partial [Cyanobacteriota bacterium]